jgi:membrane protein DedA with SNARE-associated domain
VPERLIEVGPYVGLFLALCLAGLGVPIPEEIPIVTAGVLANHGVVLWWLALPVCMAGVLLGDSVLYWVGHHWGERVLRLPMFRRLLTSGRRERLTASYRRYGVWIVFAARHVVGLRAAAFLTAGIVRVPFRKFLAADGTAVGYGVPLTFGLAFFFTDQINRLLGQMHRVELWIGVLALAAAGGWLGVALWRRNRRLLVGEERGDEAAESTTR